MSQLWILQIVEFGFFDPIALLFFVAAAVAFWAVWVVLRRPLDLGDSEAGEKQGEKEEEAPATPPDVSTHPSGRPRRPRRGGSRQ